MRNDFAILILTHGRADCVYTTKSLRQSNYTGRIVYVIDNEDEQIELYKHNFGSENVIVFDKKKEAETTDAMDNLPGRTAILWARNASFEIARNLGLTYFQMLDDDITDFQIRGADKTHEILRGKKVPNYDKVIELLIKFLEDTGAKSVALGQGGDWIGGIKAIKKPVMRKLMNSFVCRADNPIKFAGRMNEDVNNYVRGGMIGEKYFSLMPIMLVPKATQSVKGGMTEEYLATGTYQKSFYSVMMCPSAVKIGMINGGHSRVHHSIDWSKCEVKIIEEKYRRV